MHIHIKENLRKMSLLTRVAPFYIALFSIILMYVFIVCLPLIIKESTVSVHATPVIRTTDTTHTTASVAKKTTIIGTPLRLIVPTLNMDLAVNDGVYDSANDSWSLSKTAVQFALITTKPNNIRGNTVIYGHNTQAVLAPMKDIAVGDTVSIKTTNGRTFNYVYTHDEIVDPSFTEVFNQNPATPQLTVLTCEGVWSTVRRLMYFDFQNVT